MDLEQRIKAIRKKYPKAKTDSFQHSCMQWEIFNGDKGSWVAIGSGYDAGQIAGQLSKDIDMETCINTGLAVQVLSEQPDSPPVGFQVLCFEEHKDLLKEKLIAAGIKVAELSWTPAAEHRKSFDDWQANYKEE
ncbi:hypothetical protein ACFLUE_00065 [Chloroflexota bacterium]